MSLGVRVARESVMISRVNSPNLEHVERLPIRFVSKGFQHDSQLGDIGIRRASKQQSEKQTCTELPPFRSKIK